MISRSNESRSDRVYVIKTEGWPFVKIGYTTRNPEGRLAALQTGCPVKLHVLHWYWAGEDTERRLHSAAASFHETGEWFRIRGHMRAALREVQRHAQEGLRERDFAVHIGDLLEVKRDGDHICPICMNTLGWGPRTRAGVFPRRMEVLFDDPAFSLWTVHEACLVELAEHAAGRHIGHLPEIGCLVRMIADGTKTLSIAKRLATRNGFAVDLANDQVMVDAKRVAERAHGGCRG